MSADGGKKNHTHCTDEQNNTRASFRVTQSHARRRASCEALYPAQGGSRVGRGVDDAGATGAPGLAGRSPARERGTAEGARPGRLRATLASPLTAHPDPETVPRSGGPGVEEVGVEGRRGRRESRKCGTTQRVPGKRGHRPPGPEPGDREAGVGRERGREKEEKKKEPLAGARRPHTLTCPSPSPPARRRLPSCRGPRVRVRAHTRFGVGGGGRTRTHAAAAAAAGSASSSRARARARLSPSSAHSKPGARPVAAAAAAVAAVAAAQPPWPPLRQKHARTPPRPRPDPASKAELGAVSRLSLPHPASGSQQEED
ncbi:serine/arginine repetitive matrix protein 3-like [Onychomys torridus]|uniref:serine/arginine repetitive matrix protein 3-like n=1 Tax=Onychomys torridus TaxID=38674 RepID=UPI00167F8313|nr:serine/arginine repetitive matrix protein 3-like [Onychomys torridus]